MKNVLEFGLNAALPPRTKVAWGARLIYPDDLVPDRKSQFGMYDPEKREYTPKGQKLREWLNNGALGKALKASRFVFPRSYDSSGIDPERIKVMYEDEAGVIKGCPAGGYVYVAAWLKTQ
jgi:hypothetical protein